MEEQGISEEEQIKEINRKRNLMILGLGLASYFVYTKYNKTAGILLAAGGFIFIDFASEMNKGFVTK